jgi:hypothetical protein
VIVARIEFGASGSRRKAIISRAKVQGVARPSRKGGRVAQRQEAVPFAFLAARRVDHRVMGSSGIVSSQLCQFNFAF